MNQLFVVAKLLELLLMVEIFELPLIKNIVLELLIVAKGWWLNGRTKEARFVIDGAAINGKAFETIVDNGSWACGAIVNGRTTFRYPNDVKSFFTSSIITWKIHKVIIWM